MWGIEEDDGVGRGGFCVRACVREGMTGRKILGVFGIFLGFYGK